MIATLQEKTRPNIGAVAVNASAGTVNGTGVSRLTDALNEVLVLLNIGAMGAAMTLDVKLQESTLVGSGYVDIAGAAFTQKVTATDPNTISELYVNLNKTARLEFIRVVAVTAGANQVAYAVTLLFGKPRVEPT